MLSKGCDRDRGELKDGGLQTFCGDGDMKCVYAQVRDISCIDRGFWWLALRIVSGCGGMERCILIVGFRRSPGLINV